MCCRQPSGEEMNGYVEVWWRRVQTPMMTRVFSTKESAEKFLEQDIEKLVGPDVEVYRKLLWQMEQAEG